MQIYYYKCVAYCHMSSIPNIIFSHLRVQINQTNGPSVILMNLLEVNEVTKVNNIKIIIIFVHKYECVMTICHCMNSAEGTDQNKLKRSKVKEERPRNEEK